MEQYLNFIRNDLLEHKRRVVQTLVSRADRLVSDEMELRREKEHIRKALWVNSCPDWMLVDLHASDQLDLVQEERE